MILTYVMERKPWSLARSFISCGAISLQVRYFPTENLARDHLKRHGVEHYWDLALSQAIVEQEGD